MRRGSPALGGRRYDSARSQATPQRNTTRLPDLNAREWAATLPLIVMMVWMGIYSQSFLPPVSKVTAHVLDQTQINVPFRVQIPNQHPAARTAPLEAANAH